MASADHADGQPIVPEEAPEPPAHPVLKHLAWKPMWIEDSNAVWVVVGDPGDGKSRASLRIGEAIWPGFQIDAVAQNIVEFMELVLDDSFGQGSVVVLEEGSVEASAYEWYSESNEVFRTVLETWRHQNRMAIINLPNFQSLDKGARRRTDVIIEMLEAKPWKGYSVAKPKEVDYNNIEDYFKTPFPILEGTQHKRIRFNQPSADLLADYERLKEEYTSNLNEQLYDKIRGNDEASDDEEGKSIKEIATEIAANGLSDFVSEDQRDGSPYINWNLIRVHYELSQKDAQAVKALLDKQFDQSDLEGFA